MKISLVILTYNTKEITDICVSKALVASNYLKKRVNTDIEIIVVDNGSLDGTSVFLKRKYPNITVIENKKNLGVSKGYNIGMNATRETDFILLLNSDLYLDENALFKSVKYFEKNKKCDVLICKLYNKDNIFEPYGGHLPTPLRTIFWLLGIESIPVLSRFVNRIYGYNSNLYEQDFQMEWAPSCFYFLKHEVFKKTKGHDEKIFLYMDDLEWCKRIKDAGFKLFYTPTFSSVHLCGASTVGKGLDLWRLKQQTAGIKYYQRKHHPQSAVVISFILRLGFLMRSVLYFVKGNRLTARFYIQSLSASL